MANSQHQQLSKCRKLTNFSLSHIPKLIASMRRGDHTHFQDDMHVRDMGLSVSAFLWHLISTSRKYRKGLRNHTSSLSRSFSESSRYHVAANILVSRYKSDEAITLQSSRFL
ncbi:hypothetical protein HBI56_128200 [Parastagonospora nodorum]|uniref:Uncharacterized protein n=1 Tax=Phaeosphaeria nodorum (strain SN15 / ATCC MYA-4574 / FGSC 10173) TaxID=321614 RepID=A0A7U2EZ94_PHANO|nr:hypothetical protein HBH56_155630 [Parastagonospora nodorum]QRC95844.1 hypothetical protein JI435_432830 [Parastagonospora nodorum SN15]KAH3926584.1 hypothetical protein HBH54_162040 [Parastagonospora nodorum]KAH3943190.1 hypothetical protein HBH53_177120 [Parastagonospora nodorum]KAH3972135.1 hypothetical protein HBH51_104380 [Parastagonospora nodorum]